MGPFNTREIASAFWIIVFLVGVLATNAEVRKSVAGVLRALLNPKILASVFAMALYTSAAVWLLAVFHLWTPSLLKDTILWFCASAVVLMVRFVTSRNADNMFKKVVIESITIVIVLEFLVNTYTFPLPVELIMVPVLALLGGLAAFADSDERYRQVGGCIKGAQGLVGLTILAVALVRAVSDLNTLGTLETFRSIALPPLLSLLFIPCLYGLVLASKYELVVLRLDLGTEKDSKLKRYARRRILLAAGLSLSKIQRLLRDHSGDLMQAETEADVDRLLERLVE